MNQPSIQDTIIENIPSHIKETHPNFVKFLEYYYSWLSKEDNPFNRLESHMDYLSFEKSFDKFLDHMQHEYATDVPVDLFGDRERFIEWSRKLNLARGSHESYKFLFRLLYGDNETEIYLPKENMLRVSDGKWISGQHSLFVTNSGNKEKFLYKKIAQRTYFEDEQYVEYASGVVSGFNIFTTNGLNLLELIVEEIEGEFVYDEKIYVKNDISLFETPVPTISGFEILSGGSNYFINQQLKLFYSDGSGEYDGLYTYTTKAKNVGEVDTNITTRLRESSFKVEIEGKESTDFTYGGRCIFDDKIKNGDEITITTDFGYFGSTIIEDIDENGSIRNIKYVSSSVAVDPYSDLEFHTTESYGDGLKIKPIIGVLREIPGYYKNQDSHISSNMFIQDSFFYQDYSYQIVTQVDIPRYEDIVKDILHPAGTKMFGKVTNFNLLKTIIGAVQEDSGSFIANNIFMLFSVYTMGPSYSWIDKASYMSPRVYKGDEWEDIYVKGEDGYSLEDKSLERAYDITNLPYVVDKKGWMSKNNLSDFDIVQPQDFVESDKYKGRYLESSYTLTPEMDKKEFVNKHIDIYISKSYIEPGYSEA